MTTEGLIEADSMAAGLTPVKSAPQKTIGESLAVQYASFVTLFFSTLTSDSA